MGLVKPFSKLVRALSIALMAALIVPIYGQINTPCTPSMLTTFTPCMNFLTNSTGNASSPTSDCCNSLRSLMSNGTECLCLIVTGSVPFRIPINRTLAISLPRACNMPGVPLQCRASAVPVPAPGPLAFGPTVSPNASPSSSPTAIPGPVSPALAPESDETPATTPPTTTVSSQGPTTSSTGSRPVVQPSAALPSRSFSPMLLLALLGAVAFKHY